ncbi:DNA polymerase I, partial [Candidatus Berkelbacteria bacterium]|nr:DNA polymerase I [Candidatus Berkelbacteria bacterium]
SDNIPGVAGIGPKTALELISRFGALENIYQNIKKLPEKTRQRLLENKEAAFLSQKIATIRRDVPIRMDLEKARVSHYNNVRVRAIFQELGFYSLLKRLEKPSLF